jgi:hypothetical protein
MTNVHQGGPIGELPIGEESVDPVGRVPGGMSAVPNADRDSVESDLGVGSPTRIDPFGTVDEEQSPPTRGVGC